MIITVTSGSKGGTGKSTVALGLSVILSLRGYAHELYDYSCSIGVCTGVYYYLNDFIDGINRLSKLVKVKQGLPPQGYEGLAIVDLPPMSLAQPEFIDIINRSDVLIVISSYEPDSVTAVEKVLEAYQGSKVVRLCNMMPTEDCRHYLKATPESPFFVIGEPTNFKTLSELATELGFTNNEQHTRASRQFTVNGVKAKLVSYWDPYAIIGIEAVGKWYYGAVPFTRPIEDLVKLLRNALGTTYVYKLGFANGNLEKLLRAKH